MANVAHSTLTGSNLHENKGVSSATDNTVATAVSGATVWSKLTASNLTGTGNSFGAQLLHVQDQKASGTNGGTFSSGSWQTRTLNTTLTNEISSASLGSNQVTLPAGTYYLEASAIACRVGGHQTKWYNVTDASDTLIGTSEKCDDGGVGYGTRSFVAGRFTIAGSKVFELRHRCSNSASNTGFGDAAGFSVVEVYSDVRIWKVA